MNILRIHRMPIPQQRQRKKKLFTLIRFIPIRNLKQQKIVGKAAAHIWDPRIKTEYNYINDEDFEPHITTKQIPYSATELAKLRKEYGWLPQESETEYAFRVSLTGGDKIKLTEQEASGYWGHGVFLTTGDKRDTWSLTEHTALQAGGINPLERGDPLAIVSTPNQLLESDHKATCLQMIHKKRLTPGFESPMQLPVKPELMTPLIWGLPESLLLQGAPSLPFSKITNVKQHPFPSGAKEGIKSVIQDLQDQGLIVNTHSPYNSPVWPAQKASGNWRLSVDFGRLHANTDPLTAVVPNLAELITSIQEKAHSVMATIDVKDMIFMIPIQPEDMDCFAFTWEGQQYTFTRLPQGYKHSLTLAHHALAQELENIPKSDNVAIYHYIVISLWEEMK